MMGYFRRCRAIFALAALVSLAACTSWQPYHVPSARPAPLPSEVRVTLDGGASMTFVRPRILNDTLLVGRATRHGTESLSAPISRIYLLEARRLNWGKTGVVVAVLMVAGGAAYRFLQAWDTSG